jgi:copper chaperone CopZ
MMTNPSDPHDLRPTDKAVLETDTIALAGVMQEGHARAIEKALRDAEGVRKVKMNLSAEQVTVTFDARRTHVPTLHDLILKTGYHPAGVDAVK